MAYEEDIVEESLKEFAVLQAGRTLFNTNWQEAAELVMPQYKDTFGPGMYNTQPGAKKTERQVDSTASIGNSRFAAICDSLLTPRNGQWHGLEADNADLQKLREVKLYYEAATRMLFKQRYKPTSNFSSQNLNTFQMLGCFGNGVLHIDQLRNATGSIGLRYKSLPLGEIYLRENFQGQVDGYCRGIFRLNKKQALHQFPDGLPKEILECTDDARMFEFLQRVCPRTDYDPARRDAKAKPFASYYISLLGKKLVQESGYNTLPIAVSRYGQGPSEIYGRGPAMIVLGAIKSLNAEKRDFLTQGHRSAVPIFLTGDDGLVDFSWRPGAMNKGGVSADGKPLVHTLPTGNIQTTLEMMQEEKIIIDDAFLVTLFKVVQDNPQMTATQVLEIVNQKGILLAPTVGQQQSEYLGPMIERELDLMSYMRLLPPLPEILREARGEYNVVYTSPLAKQMRAQEVAGFGRTMEILMGIVNLTQDPEPLDEFNFSKAGRGIAEIQSVPEEWMASKDEIAAKKQKRADLMKAQMETQQAPAAAALMGAQAKQAAAGMKPGGPK